MVLRCFAPESARLMNTVFLVAVLAGALPARALQGCDGQAASCAGPAEAVRPGVEDYALLQSYVKVAAGHRHVLRELGPAAQPAAPLSLVATLSVKMKELTESADSPEGGGSATVRVFLIVVLAILVFCLGTVLAYLIFDPKTSSLRQLRSTDGHRDSLKPYVFETEIVKTGPDEMLGMDVKYVQGRLQVVQIIPGGAVDRTNKEKLAKSPAREVLQVGDMIQRINSVQSNDQQMVAECSLNTRLNLVVARMPRNSLRGQVRGRGTDLAKAVMSGSITASSSDYDRLQEFNNRPAGAQAVAKDSSAATSSRRSSGSVEGGARNSLSARSSVSQEATTINDPVHGTRQISTVPVSQRSEESPHPGGSPLPGGWTLPNGDHMPPPLCANYFLPLTEARFAASVSALAAFRYEGGLDVYGVEGGQGSGIQGSPVLRITVRQATDRPGRLLEATLAKPGSPPCAVYKPRGRAYQKYDAESYEILASDGELYGYLDPRPDSSYAITNKGGSAMLVINEGDDEGIWLTVTTRDGEPVASVACTSSSAGGSEHLEILVRSRTDAVLVVSSVFTMLLLTADLNGVSPGSSTR